MKRVLAITIMLIGAVNLCVGWLTPSYSMASWLRDHSHVRDTYHRLIEEGMIVQQQLDSDVADADRIVYDLTPRGLRPSMYFMIGFVLQGVVLLVVGYLLMPAGSNQSEHR